MDIFVNEKKILQGRMPLVSLFIIFVFAILVVNLVNLQVVKGNENLFLSSTIKTSEVVVRAPRGLIYDRSGKELVINRPAFRLVLDLTLIRVEDEQALIEKLAGILEVPVEDLYEEYNAKAYKDDGTRTTLSQVTLVNNVDRNHIVSIYSRTEELPGVYIEVGTTREYADGRTFAHILGYVREVSQADLDKGGYYAGDIIGSTGIEQYYDEILRGENGRRILETNKDETLVRELMPVEATAGDSIKLSLDYDMQEKMTEALGNGISEGNLPGGAAVIIDISTGEVVTMVSLPTFDANEIIRGLSPTQYAQLSQDPNLPLYNRSISLTQPPGSTFKTIVGASALQEGAITTQTIFRSTGCMNLGGGYDFCEAGKRYLGDVDFAHAVSRSSNVYFCNTMLRLGIDKLDEYATYFGLGQKTGIDLYGEQPGSVSSKQLKEEIEGEQWYQGDSCNAGIGQGLTRVSPLQMAAWTAAIANGGTYYKPHLAIEVLDGEGRVKETFSPEVLHTLPIDAKNLDAVRDGMHLAVNDPGGSAFPLRGVASDPAAKTGSAEALRKVNGVFVAQAHSWVTGFFPYDNPKYAFAVYLEHGGWGYKSTEVMKEFFTWYDSR